MDIAFLFGVWQEQWKYHDVNKELITQLQPHVVFPMHIRPGDEDEYFEPFKLTFDPMLEDGCVVLTNNIKGIFFHYIDGEIITN